MTNIITTDGGLLAVQNQDGSIVGFAATIKIAQEIKSRADQAIQTAAQLAAEGYSLGW